MMSNLYNVGVDAGGTNIKFCVLDGTDRLLIRRSIPTTPHEPRAFVTSIIENIGQMLRDASISVSNVNSIGIGIPGTTDSRRGIVVFAPNLSLKNYEIVKVVRGAFDVPVYSIQDSRAAAWGEFVAGAGRGLSGVVSITLGTGIGCGLVIDGKIFHGALNTAGEFGHQLVQLNGRQCACGRRGCLEAYAGGGAILREAKESIPGLSIICGKNLDAVTVKDIYDLAESGNCCAISLIQNGVQYLGIGLVNLVNIVSPEVVCLSGGISNAHPRLLLDPLIEFVRTRAYPVVAKRINVCRSPLGADAPLIGAASLHKERLSMGRRCTEGVESEFPARVRDAI